jgi:hypothetical protein
MIRSQNQPSSLEVEEEEFEEAVGLLSTRHFEDFEETTPQGKRIRQTQWYWWGLTVGLVSLFTLLLKDQDLSHPIILQCPVEEELIIQSSSISTPQTVLKDSIAYKELKNGLQDFLIRHFVPNLNDGDAILESECGDLMNLILTLDVLNEQGNITNLAVYGNTASNNSIPSIGMLLTEMSNKTNNSASKICMSTDLSFIPEDSFDLVFTGYFRVADSERVESLCQQNNSIAIQEFQNDYFSQWVGEMVRVAKPGAPIIIENVSPAFCPPSPTNTFSSCGIDRPWWKSFVRIDDIPVHPESLVLEKSRLVDKEYHVIMNKEQIAE